MTSTDRWDRAAALPARAGDPRRPELVALPADRTPAVDELFSFMRDAELRFSTLRMRIEETTMTASGQQVVGMDLLLRHPGDARVTTSEPGRGTAGNYELWLSDGEMVRTYSAVHRLGTRRPVRHTIRGLDGPNSRDFPGTSLVYVPLTPLPMETLPDTFVHPAGYCQNVLATGICRLSGGETIGGRPAIVLECDHPRTTEVSADRPDFHIQVAIDRADGVILRLVETIGGAVTRRAEAVAYAPDAPLPPTAFDFEFPAGTTMMF
jgi:outer membrane lipoprotein-sorting protein